MYQNGQNNEANLEHNFFKPRDIACSYMSRCIQSRYNSNLELATHWHTLTHISHVQWCDVTITCDMITCNNYGTCMIIAI